MHLTYKFKVGLVRQKILFCIYVKHVKLLSLFVKINHILPIFDRKIVIFFKKYASIHIGEQQVLLKLKVDQTHLNHLQCLLVLKIDLNLQNLYYYDTLKIKPCFMVMLLCCTRSHLPFRIHAIFAIKNTMNSKSGPHYFV